MSIFKHKKFVFAILFVLLALSFLPYIAQSLTNINNELTYASLSDIDYAIKNKTFGNLWTLSYGKNLQAQSGDDLIKVDLKFLC